MDIATLYRHHSAKGHHNQHHIEQMLVFAQKHFFEEKFYQNLVNAIIYHDVVYNPYSATNEEDSAKLFRLHAPGLSLSLSESDIEDISDAILHTKVLPNVFLPKSHLGAFLSFCDYHVFFTEDLSELIRYEMGIFYEYQNYPIAEYRKARLEFLNSLLLGPSGFFDWMGFSEKFSRAVPNYSKKAQDNIKWLCNFVDSKVYKVGYYVGSFQPFHVGHKDVLDQAEKVFDKVIICRGINPEKTSNPKPRSFKFRRLSNETKHFSGLVTQLFDPETKIEKTLIRGVRNSSDLLAEEAYRSWVKELNPQITMIYFMSNPSLSHISSSYINQLSKLQVSVAKYIYEEA